jgi:hypothetical protein
MGRWTSAVPEAQVPAGKGRASKVLINDYHLRKITRSLTAVMPGWLIVIGRVRLAPRSATA